MWRIAGTPNKITTEVKSKLESLTEGLVGSLDISELNANQRIKLLQIALQYTLHILHIFCIFLIYLQSCYKGQKVT